jgi:hypothetical protein
MKVDHTLTAYRFGLVIAALQAGPLSAHDLAPKIFLCYGHAWRVLKLMHQQGLVHIAKWPLRRTNRCTRVAAYAAGPGKDAKKPAALTGPQKQARCRHKARQDGDRYALIRAKDRARKRKPARDPLVAAMFGALAAQEVRHA